VYDADALDGDDDKCAEDQYKYQGKQNTKDRKSGVKSAKSKSHFFLLYEM
jgi:hypothetical protein